MDMIKYALYLQKLAYESKNIIYLKVLCYGQHITKVNIFFEGTGNSGAF